MVQYTVLLGHQVPDSLVFQPSGRIGTPITHLSFNRLLQWNSPIDDSIVHSFLTILCHRHDNASFLDTNFSRVLFHQGWSHAYKSFSLHEHLSRYTLRLSCKPSLQTDIIIIPIHIQDSHWVALTRRRIGDQLISSTPMIWTRHTQKSWYKHILIHTTHQLIFIW